MRYIAYGLGGIIALVLIVVVIGYALPVKHTATRERTFPVTSNLVFNAISTPAEFPHWRSGVKRVDLLPDSAGKKRFREESSDGNITYTVDEATPFTRLVTRIDDRSLPFGGSWTHELTPVMPGTSTLLRITENGEVYNPIFRFMSRFVFGHASTMEKYLDDLERKLGAETAVRAPRTSHLAPRT
jgi:uncharacterized protein YndB with AHSA1/START domain